jgi:hypothetical protein
MAKLAEKVRTEAGYSEKSTKCMRYPEFRQQGLFVHGRYRSRMQNGDRFPLEPSGMFWTVRGADAILALRCCQFNGRFEGYWKARRAS